MCRDIAVSALLCWTSLGVYRDTLMLCRDSLTYYSGWDCFYICVNSNFLNLIFMPCWYFGMYLAHKWRLYHLRKHIWRIESDHTYVIPWIEEVGLDWIIEDLLPIVIIYIVCYYYIILSLFSCYLIGIMIDLLYVSNYQIPI